uniref:Uncharacterized protein n=1 Tax=Meloidogyne enterolobii TaxID=390850 RepID=A0A6V7VW67_MELEN|nr:unnamed protein product [Meloidogyne enterolobii]
MSKFFKNVCNSYREVDECLLRCESKSKQVADLKTAYAGLQFVCKQRKEGKKIKIIIFNYFLKSFSVHCLAFLSKFK